MKKIVIFFIRIYRNYLSCLKINSCRFYPTCSCYTIEAVEKLGVIKGLSKGIVRIIKCNPLSSGGFDPVVKEK